MLGKKKLHELVVSKLKNVYEIPKCMDCTYKKFGKYERITFYTSDVVISFTTLLCGSWNHLVIRNEDDVIICDAIM